MVATLAVLGATCALPVLASAKAATAPPRAGAYIDARSTFGLRVAKDRKTVPSLQASCFVNRVQTGSWELHRRLRIADGRFAYEGPIKVEFESGTVPLTFTIHGRFEQGRFRGSATTSTPTRCTTLRFSAKFLAHPDA